MILGAVPCFRKELIIKGLSFMSAFGAIPPKGGTLISQLMMKSNTSSVKPQVGAGDEVNGVHKRNPSLHE